MRTSFLTILALVSVALVNGAPTVVIPTLAKGGDATSGYSGNVGGGSVYNSGGFVLNTAFANQGAKAGLTSSGIAVGGNGAGGGSATSGSTGTAYGGDVQNYGGVIVNGYKSNQGGNGGIAVSGAAIGGNAWKRTTSTLSFGKGGDVKSGYSGSVDGGNVFNSGGFVLNTAFANQGGKAGLTQSGIAAGGNGLGGGGSATSGSTGNAYGGDVQNYGSVIVNGYKSNTGGNGGIAASGAAIGGNAWKKSTIPFTFGKGGDAKSGYSGSVDGGNVINQGGFIYNNAFANKGGHAGLTASGVAVGGNGLGGGGSATSGSTGNAIGGSVVNSGYVIVNGYKANQGGDGGIAVSGAAYGGNGY